MSQKPNDATHWANLEEKGSYLGIKILFALYSTVGRFLLVPILYPVVFYYFLFGREGRRGSMLFLARAKQAGAHVDANYWHSFKHFMAFAQSILDKLSSWAGKIPRAEVNFPTRPKLREAIESGRGGIIIGSHLGSVEVGRAFSRDMPGFKLNVLVHTHHAGNFNKMMKAVNPDFQTELIQVTNIGPDTAMLLKQKVENGEFVAILGDRVPVESKGREVRLPFLGDHALFPQGPYILSAVLGCPLYMLTCLRGANGFEVFFDELAEEVKLPRKTRQQAIENYAQSYVEKLAAYATQYPYQWFNFFDFWRDDRDNDAAG